MDPYERLAAINEKISRPKDNVQLDESDDFVFDPITKKKVKVKRIKQKMGGPATKWGKPVSVGKSKHRQKLGLESVDEYERLTTINETLMGKIKSLFKGKPKKETPVQMFNRLAAGIEKRTPDEVAAKLDVETRQRDKKIFGESTEAERIDQAGVKGKKALKDAGLKFKFRQSIGSMNREDNHFIVSPEDVEAARKALKGVSNAQVKTK